MSRGLSDQQRRILGMGVRVNRSVHHGEVKPTVERVEDGKAWCIHTLPEVTTRAVMRFVHGMRFHGEEQRLGGSLFDPHPRYRSLEASTSRALLSLNKQGYIWWWPGGTILRSVRDTMESKRMTVDEALRYYTTDLGAEFVGMGLMEGYKLTPEGIEVGMRYELDIPFAEVRLDLVEMMRPTNWREMHAMLALQHLHSRDDAVSIPAV